MNGINLIIYEKETGLITMFVTGPSETIAFQNPDEGCEIAYGVIGQPGQIFDPVTNEVTDLPS